MTTVFVRAAQQAGMGFNPDFNGVEQAGLGYYQVTNRDSTVFYGAVDRAFGYAKAIDIARNYPDLDAAITFNDLIALGMLAGFAEAGVVIGKDFRLVGFDDIKEAAQTFPKLSSIIPKEVIFDSFDRLFVSAGKARSTPWSC